MDFKVTGDGCIALIGIIVGYFGVYKTIKKSEEQFKEEIKRSEKQFKDDKRISVKPYLDIKLKELLKSTNSFDFISINKLKNLNLYEKSFIGIELSNLGQGNCLDCKLIEIKIDGRKINDGLNVGSIGVNESILREITFKTYYGDILNEVKEEFIGKNTKDYEEFTYKYLLKEVELQFEYKDVLDNKYRKTIIIEVFIKFDILAEKYIWEISDIKFNDIYFEINGNLTTEELIK